MRDSPLPYVICPMLPSIDGRIVTRGWDLREATREYERTAATFGAERRRVPAPKLQLMTMEKRAGGIVWLRYKVRR